MECGVIRPKLFCADPHPPGGPPFIVIPSPIRDPTSPYMWDPTCPGMGPKRACDSQGTRVNNGFLSAIATTAVACTVCFTCVPQL